MKYLFIGCVESSYWLLKTLIEKKNMDSTGKIQIVGVITLKESSYNSDFVDLVPLCKDNNVDCICVKSINDEISRQYIIERKPDIGFCFGWSQLVKPDIINLFDRGMIGFHPAALPQNRGRHPLIWALVLGLQETASTFFRIVEDADAGNIVSQKTIEIKYEDDAQSLYSKVVNMAMQQESDLIDAFESNCMIEIPQVSSSANSWRKRGRMDGIIDWRMSSRAIYNLVRGLTHPYIGAEFEYKDRLYKVWKVQELPKQPFVDNIEPGKVLKCAVDGSMDVKCYDGVIRLLEYEYIDLVEGDYL